MLSLTLDPPDILMPRWVAPPFLDLSVPVPRWLMSHLVWLSSPWYTYAVISNILDASVRRRLVSRLLVTFVRGYWCLISLRRPCRDDQVGCRLHLLKYDRNDSLHRNTHLMKVVLLHDWGLIYWRKEEDVTESRPAPNGGFRGHISLVMSAIPTGENSRFSWIEVHRYWNPPKRGWVLRSNCESVESISYKNQA